jgi:oligoendopeptidase F
VDKLEAKKGEMEKQLKLDEDVLQNELKMDAKHEEADEVLMVMEKVDNETGKRIAIQSKSVHQEILREKKLNSLLPGIMSLVAPACGVKATMLDLKIAEVQSFLDEDPECAPLQHKLEKLIRQRRDELPKVSYGSVRYRSSVMLSVSIRHRHPS